ncbi:unnamed protein product, partial [Brassica napus]
IENSERANDISFVHMMNSREDIIHQQDYENVVFSSSEKSTEEKLPPKKKAITDSYLDKACEEVTEITSQIFGMIQKRWEKEAEEKEAEDKANNVWDANNEIPDLDDDLRYEAMTLVHSLGMKSGFVKMSVQCIDKGLKCYGWFFRLWSFSIFLVAKLFQFLHDGEYPEAVISEEPKGYSSTNQDNGSVLLQDKELKVSSKQLLGKRRGL